MKFTIRYAAIATAFILTTSLLVQAMEENKIENIEGNESKQLEEQFLSAVKNDKIKIVIMLLKNVPIDLINKALDLTPSKEGSIAKILTHRRDLLIKEQELLLKEQKSEKNALTSDKEDLACDICLENIKEDDTVSYLKCKHPFHTECLERRVRDEKIKSKTTFPCSVCRKEYKISGVLSEEEIKKIEHVHSFIEPASNGNLAAAKEILKNHDLVTDDDLVTILYNAKKKDFSEIIKEFLKTENKHILEKIDDREGFQTFFEYAVKNNEVKIIDFFLHKLPVSTSTIDAFIVEAINAFVNAARYNQLETIKFFLNTEKISGKIGGETILSAFLNAAVNDRIEIIDFFLNTEELNKYIGKSEIKEVFIRSAEYGRLEMIKFFLANKEAEIKQKTIEGAFETAAKNCRLEVIEFFLNNNLNNKMVKISDAAIQMAFETAAKDGRLEVIEFFLNNKTVKISDATIQRAFGAAAQNGRLEVIEFFLDNKTVKISDVTIQGAFEAAAENGRLKVIEFFLNNKTVKISDATIQMAFKTAAKDGRLEVIEFFLDNKTVKISNASIQKAFLAAAQNGRLEAIEFFLDNKIVEISDATIQKAFEIAAKEDEINIINFFINNASLLSKITEATLNKAFIAATKNTLNVFHVFINNPALLSKITNKALNVAFTKTTDLIFINNPALFSKITDKTLNTVFKNAALDNLAVFQVIRNNPALLGKITDETFNAAFENATLGSDFLEILQSFVGDQSVFCKITNDSIVKFMENALLWGSEKLKTEKLKKILTCEPYRNRLTQKNPKLKSDLQKILKNDLKQAQTVEMKEEINKLLAVISSGSWEK